MVSRVRMRSMFFIMVLHYTKCVPNNKQFQPGMHTDRSGKRENGRAVNIIYRMLLLRRFRSLPLHLRLMSDVDKWSGSDLYRLMLTL